MSSGRHLAPVSLHVSLLGLLSVPGRQEDTPLERARRALGPAPKAEFVLEGRGLELSLFGTRIPGVPEGAPWSSPGRRWPWTRTGS
jgi:hypothetical protein